MNELIDNLINGNLETARRMAKSKQHWQIREALFDYGWSEKKATIAADWLKGRNCWQEACDA